MTQLSRPRKRRRLNGRRQSERSTKTGRSEDFLDVAKPIQGLKDFVTRRRPSIDEVVRETTSGGIVFRRNPKKTR